MLAWADLDVELAAVPGTISVYAGRLDGPPAHTRLPTATHYAASTMKIAVLATLYRAAEAGRLDLDAPVPVRNEFDSARPGAPRFSCEQHYDNDHQVWARLGGTAPLSWLARRMIIRSSNLATNLIISQIGLGAIAQTWARAGARHSATGRGIEDFAARDAGIDNRITAADLAALLGAIALGAQAPGPVAGPDACAAMLDMLFDQERREDLAAGLPTGTRIAHKNGWVHGVRHGAGVVFPDDAPPYCVVVCTSAELAGGDHAGTDRDAEACRLIAHVSATVWAARHRLGD